MHIIEMEPRRTRSSYLSPPKSSRNTRMVKSTRVPSHELAKLKTSKPMLVIPQPVLRIHECLDENVRMAQVESNAYIALGIKEEPIDEEYDAEGRHYEEADFTAGSFSESFVNQDSFHDETEETEGRRTTRASKRRRLAGLDEQAVNNEDDNNNSKKASKKRASKGKRSISPNPEFRPIVLSVHSLAPAEAQTPISDADLPNLLSAQTEKQPAEGNNNNEKVVLSDNCVPDPKTLIESQQEITTTLQEKLVKAADSPTDQINAETANATKSTTIEKPEVHKNGPTSPAKELRRRSAKPAVETDIEPALPEDAAQNPFMSTVVEDEEEEDDDEEQHSDVDFQVTSSSSSEEESEAEAETFRKPIEYRYRHS